MRVCGQYRSMNNVTAGIQVISDPTVVIDQSHMMLIGQRRSCPGDFHGDFQ